MGHHPHTVRAALPLHPVRAAEVTAFGAWGMAVKDAVGLTLHDLGLALAIAAAIAAAVAAWNYRALQRRLGARGVMLLVLAALWARLFVWPLIEGRGAGAGLFYYEWPTSLRVTLWAASLAVAVVAAFVPPRRDWFGWVALVIMPTQRLTAWAWAGITGTIPTGRAVEQTILYGLLVTAVIVAALMRPPALEATEEAG